MMSCQRLIGEKVDSDIREQCNQKGIFVDFLQEYPFQFRISEMKLPQIKRATWEKQGHPYAKWIVVDRKYNVYFPCTSIYKAIRCWFMNLEIAIKRKRK